MHDIYYIEDVFPWAGFNSSLTIHGALDHHNKYIENWEKVYSGNKDQLLNAIEKLNPMRLLNKNINNFTTSKTNELFNKLILLVRCKG